LSGENHDDDDDDENVHGDFDNGKTTERRTRCDCALVLKRDSRRSLFLRLLVRACIANVTDYPIQKTTLWAYPIPRVLAAFVVAYIASGIVQVSASWACPVI
jgi:hypothetical protein